MKRLTGSIILISFIILSCAKQHDSNMILIKGGTFFMGSPSEEAERDFDEILNQVTVSSFYMGKYEVTQSEYMKIMRKNPSNFKGDNLPVERVSWYEAIEYCNSLSRQEGLVPVYNIIGTDVTWDRNAGGYRLPTEAEWEFACRAGTVTPFSTGNNITTEQANYDGNYSYMNEFTGSFPETTVPVGTFHENSFGLYDMHGNVFEWCWDWYGDYSREVKNDPQGALKGTFRVIRGGSWINGGHALRSAFRGIYFPEDGNERIGFRLARNAEQD